MIEWVRIAELLIFFLHAPDALIDRFVEDLTEEQLDVLLRWLSSL